MDLFLRYAAKTDYLPNSFFTRAYDSRILFVLSGKGRIYFEDRDFELFENTLCYYPAGEKYMPLSSDSSPLFFATLNFDFSLKYKNRTEAFPPVPSENFDRTKMHSAKLSSELSVFGKPFVMHDIPMLRADFVKIADVYGHGMTHSDRYFREKASALLEFALYRLLELNAKTEYGLYEKISEYISENCTSLHSNADIAAHFNYHPYYIGQIFKKACGTSLHRYLLERKLEFAGTLLSGTNKSVNEVAAESGFPDANYFSVCFAKKYGCSPTKFRALNRMYV